MLSALLPPCICIKQRSSNKQCMPLLQFIDTILKMELLDLKSLFKKSCECISDFTGALWVPASLKLRYEQFMYKLRPGPLAFLKQNCMEQGDKNHL